MMRKAKNDTLMETPISSNLLTKILMDISKDVYAY